MRLFILYRVYVKVTAMKFPSGFMGYLKDVAKGIGTPEILVADPHLHQKSKEVKYFCNKIGSTLHIIEQVTQWGNMEELYIGLLK